MIFEVKAFVNKMERVSSAGLLDEDHFALRFEKKMHFKRQFNIRISFQLPFQASDKNMTGVHAYSGKPMRAGLQGHTDWSQRTDNHERDADKHGDRVPPPVKATMVDHPTPKLPADQLRDHEGPLAFLIPGNHDW